VAKDLEANMVRLQVLWHGGATELAEVPLPQNRSDAVRYGQKFVEQIRALASQHDDGEIVALVNRDRQALQYHHDKVDPHLCGRPTKHSRRGVLISRLIEPGDCWNCANPANMRLQVSEPALIDLAFRQCRVDFILYRPGVAQVNNKYLVLGLSDSSRKRGVSDADRYGGRHNRVGRANVR
jgi:hypothetical protein